MLAEKNEDEYVRNEMLIADEIRNKDPAALVEENKN